LKVENSEIKMRSATFEIILDQLKHERDTEYKLLIEKQKQDGLQNKLILKNEEIEILKKTKAGFQKCHTPRW